MQVLETPLLVKVLHEGGRSALRQTLSPLSQYPGHRIWSDEFTTRRDQWITESWRKGMVVVRAASLSEAETVAKEDPMHSCGARSFRVRRWLVNEGTIRVNLDYTTGRFQVT
jgi:hypothetical protein